jgi:EAL and modified HD-GYP domain-containing signal transduction protein
MTAFDQVPFPLLQLAPVANRVNEWVAMRLDVRAHGDVAAVLGAVFESTELLDAIAPLACIVQLDSPAPLGAGLLERMPPNRVCLAIHAGALQTQPLCKQIHALHDEGYRVLIDGPIPPGVSLAPGLRARAHDCSATIPAPGTMLELFGPHWAYGVDSGAVFSESVVAGFEWISGAYALAPMKSAEQSDGSSRRRLLTLLGLLARDADACELEAMLKQDPALSYHLFKLVNSAAFAAGDPICSFKQAINLLGRRQLQRWLQLLLYARQQPDGMASPLLALAALRAAHMEALSKAGGGDRDDQDLAFMTGVFSLLHVLFGLPMNDIVGALNLAPRAATALLAREGRLGQWLALVETVQPGPDQIERAEIEPLAWWQSQLHGCRWAIQVNRNF